MLLAAGATVAAERTHLAPIDRNFRLIAPYPQLHAYHVAVSDALLGAPARRSCEAVVIASFEREWSVHLEQAPAGGGPQVVCTTMDRQLWAEMEKATERRNPSSPPVDAVAALARLPKTTQRFSAPLSATTAAALERLWGTMLARGEEPAEPVRCIDGTSYFIFQWRDAAGPRGGWGQCPQQGTPEHGLLDILEDLQKCARSSGTALMQQDMQLVVKVNRLAGRVE